MEKRYLVGLSSSAGVHLVSQSVRITLQPAVIVRTGTKGTMLALVPYEPR